VIHIVADLNDLPHQGRLVFAAKDHQAPAERTARTSWLI
jgi:hypothetical protein